MMTFKFKASAKDQKTYKYDAIYFVPGVDGIRYFLSHYDPNLSNLIVTNEGIKSIHKLIRVLFSEQKIITVPNLKFNGFPNTEAQYNEQIVELETYRKLYSNILDNYLPVKKAYVFSNHCQFNFFILLRKLESEGVEVASIKVDFEAVFKPIESRYLPSLFKLHLEKMSQIIGYKMYLLNMSGFTINAGIGPLSNIKSININPAPWQELANKFSVTYKTDTNNAVLFIDTPIQYYFMGVDLKKTQHNIERFFQKLISEGKEIHLKPHYQDAAREHSLSGTEVEKNITLIPSFFPVQLIMDFYTEIYAYSSTSLIAPIKGKKYSLSKFIEFKSVNALFHYWINLFESQFISMGNVECIFLPGDIMEIRNKLQYYASYQGQLNDSESIIPNILVSIAEMKILEDQVEFASNILLKIQKKWPNLYPKLLKYLTQNSFNKVKDRLF